MRVNISYSIDLEEVPGSVSDLLSQLRFDYNGLSVKFDDAMECLDSVDLHNTTLKIDEMRKELFKIDSRLMDCMNILDGYQQTLMKLRESEQGVPNDEG